MKSGTESRQLAFDLTTAGPRTDGGIAVEAKEHVISLQTVQIVSPSANVVPFLDATTIALRRNAVRSVELAGIFTVGAGSKR